MRDKVTEAMKILDEEYNRLRDKGNWNSDDIMRSNAVAQAWNTLNIYRNTSKSYVYTEESGTRLK